MVAAASMGVQQKLGRGKLRKEDVGASALAQLTRPHIESFDYFVERGLERAARGLQQVEVSHPVSGAQLRNILYQSNMGLWCLSAFPSMNSFVKYMYMATAKLCASDVVVTRWNLDWLTVDRKTCD